MRRDRIRIFGAALTMSLLALSLIFGFGLNAQAADGEIKIGAKLVKGPFNPQGPEGGMGAAGKFYGGIAIENLLVRVTTPEATNAEIRMVDSASDLAKVPRSYQIKYAPTSAGFGSLSIGGSGFACTAKSGTITITAFGAVNGVVTGTLSNLKWDDDDCDKKMGTTGSFKVQRTKNGGF